MNRIYKSSTTLLIIVFILLSGTLSAQKSENYIQPIEGEKIICPGKVEMGAQWVTYEDGKGKEQMIKHVKIKSMFVFGRLFTNYPISKGGSMVRLHEIIAYNDKHILTAFWQTSYNYYIFDRSGNMVGGKVRLTGSKNKQMKILEENILSYFPTCKELINAMSKNIQIEQDPSHGISGYNCGGKESEIK